MKNGNSIFITTYPNMLLYTSKQFALNNISINGEYHQTPQFYQNSLTRHGWKIISLYPEQHQFGSKANKSEKRKP